MFAPLVLAALALPAADVPGDTPHDAPPAGVVRPDVVRFERDVRPIFNAHCSACHGGVREAGDLNLIDERSVALLVTPGDPELSYLLDRVSDPDDETRMPPAEHGPRLSREELDVLARWIEQGAAWERHWSFAPPRRPEAPVVSDADWCRGPIDRFVLAKLDAAGLAPNPPAEPDRWLRRVSIDLTGLPPTLAEREAFLAAVEKAAVEKEGEAAYTAAVDRLLASPHFGERWASVWLDQVRYADSRGLGQDGGRTAWPYRDWVVDAFNADLPFDEFTVKQLAGDLLPGARAGDRIATVAHRLTQSNEEGGTDDEQFRTEAVLDRVAVTWQVWQGLTMECVQCHAHPYDPIAHAEYYRSVAFFNGTADADLSSDHPTFAAPRDPADFDQAAALDARIEPLRRRIWEAENALLQDPAAWEAPTDLEASISGSPGVVLEGKDDPAGPNYRITGNVARNTAVTLIATLPEGLDKLAAVRFTGLPVDPGAALKDAEWGYTISHVVAELTPPGGGAAEIKFSEVLFDEPDPDRNPKDSLKAKGASGVGPYSKMRRPRSAAFVLPNPRPVEPGTRLKITFKFNLFDLAAFPLVAKRGRIAVSGDPRVHQLWRDPAMKRARGELRELQAKRRAIPSVNVPVMVERVPQLSRPTHRFDRGNMLSKAESVSPGVPEVFGSLTDDPTADDRADRLALARWLVSEENPLTARVQVNRLWGRLFGVGLVRTEEDFGSSGERPSHPELLDDLAVRFATDYAWSNKRLLREIVLSSTYRQSAATRPGAVAADPDNRLLARGPRQRLTAEALRDQALHAAGLLTERLHGPPVMPPIPDGVWKAFDKQQWTTPAVGHPDRTRRSLYTYVKRSIPHPLMASFDAPSREFCAARRPDSNTPVQALMTLNDATFSEAAAALAERMNAAGESPRDRAWRGFLLVCDREPTAGELDALAALYKEVAALPDGPPPGEIVAGVLLNLDEALTN